MDCSLPGSLVHGIPQAGILEWVAISFSGDLPDPGIEPRSPALQTDSLLTELQGLPLYLVGSFYFWLCSAGFCLVVASRGYSLVGVCRLLIAGASLIVEHGL